MSIDPGAVEGYLAAALAAIEAADTVAALKLARSEHAGDRSPLALANRTIGTLPASERAAAGRLVGQARKQVATALEQRQVVVEELDEATLLATEATDLTVPAMRRPLGRRHVVTVTAERMADIMVGMGWEIAEGPEVEAEWFNFDALNFDVDHPARQMQDTFFVAPQDSGLVLRTHTSPVQARALLDQGAPLYIAVPGRVARTDELDATHLPVFHQMEGLAVDEGLTMAHLKGTLDRLATELFGSGIVTRLRPNFFPFTEPSAEMDLVCFICRGEQTTAPCRTCGGTGWIEWGGCGMVNENVLLACGVDPARYQGFAFGMGVERAAMFRNGLGDLREFIEGDVRFSTQFGWEI